MYKIVNASTNAKVLDSVDNLKKQEYDAWYKKMRQIYTADYFTKLDYKNYPFKSKIKIFAKKIL